MVNYQAGDVGYVLFAMGHYIESTGEETLTFLEMFRAQPMLDQFRRVESRKDA